MCKMELHTIDVSIVCIQFEIVCMQFEIVCIQSSDRS